MKIDLNTCKKGQKLLLRNGDILNYEYKDKDPNFPHNALSKDGTYKFYTNSGSYWNEGQDGRDVIEILPIDISEKSNENNKIVQSGKEDSLKILLKKRRSLYQYKVISQPESFRCLKDDDVICFEVSNGFKFYSCTYPQIVRDEINGRISIYVRGDDIKEDNSSQLFDLSWDQANLIRESVKLFNEEYTPKAQSNNQTLEEITAEYSLAQATALKIYKAKISELLTSNK